MKQIKSFVLFALVCIGLVGCVASNPNYDKSQPISTNNPAFIVDTKPQGYIATAQQINQSVPEPYQPLIELGLGIVGGGITLGSSIVALMKNKQASAAQASANSHAAAAKVLAANIPNNAVASTIESSPTPSVAATVAAHLQSVS